MNKALKLSSALKPAAFLAGPGAQPKETPSSVKEGIEMLQKRFEEFKAANDERLDGQDTLVNEKVDRINAAITEMQVLCEKLQKQQTGLIMGGGANDNRDALVQNTRRFLTMVTGNKVTVEQAAERVEVYTAYTQHFDTLVRNSMRVHNLPPDVQAALSVGSDRDGGYFVPPEMSMEMEKRIFDTSPMRQYARVIPIGSDAWEAPYKSSKGTSGGWVGEKQPRTATATGEVGTQRIPVYEQYAYPEVTQKMLDDGLINVQDFVIEDTEDEMIRTENLAFVSGNGVEKPRGFLDYASDSVTTADATRSWGVLQHVISGAAGAFTTYGTELVDIISKLHPTYRNDAVWSMNRSTEAAIRKLKDADGRMLVGFGDLRDNAFGFSLLGFPIANFEDMPDISSDSYSLAFANWRRGYFIIDRIGFRMLVDPYTNKPYVGFYITKRVGGDVRNFDAIKLMKFSSS